MSARRKADPQRNLELAAIHTGKRALGLDEDAYRGMLFNLTGHTSSAELDPVGRAKVLDRMRDLGFERSRPYTPPAPGRPRATQADKARALWGELGNAGALRDDSEAAITAFVERQTGKSRLEWCTPSELNRVIEGLKGWLARVKGT